MIDYNSVLSDTIKDIKPSGIRKFFDIAQQIEGVISLGVGEPDFKTPWSIRRTAITALEKGRTVYTANAGLADLRASISRRVAAKTGVSYDPKSEIIVTVGGSEAIDIGLRAIINPGDEVLIVEPSFVCYAPMVRLAGGVPVIINTRVEDSFKLRPEALREKITGKTKALILPYPNNPTGAVMTREDLEPIAEILRGTNILVLTDEIYSELVYGIEHTSIIELDGMSERTLYVNGFSKSYAMTGWRLGYLCAPAPLVKQILKIHQYAIMSSPTISQYAAIEALENCDAEIQSMVIEYDMRRRYLVDRFNKMGLSCFYPEGAFYIFPSIKSTGLSSEEFCERLVNEYKVAVVPGNAFGDCGEGFIRISYAYSMKHLMEASGKIEKFVQSLNGEG